MTLAELKEQRDKLLTRMNGVEEARSGEDSVRFSTASGLQAMLATLDRQIQIEEGKAGGGTSRRNIGVVNPGRGV